ncbi:MAG: glycerophosphodiester phosphodiesterase, partial [Lachnospiraceae bacterium]|nr:glycerophosphodiester phosphodiesterase [Lachnospiraceae bacterium]
MIKIILLTVVCMISAVIILYLLMIMPRMRHRPDSAPFMGVLYAHRGLHDNASEAPENSMEAFQKAVDAGFGIELDVQLSADKIPVVFHDFSLKRACGVEGKVADYTYEELQQFTLFDSEQRIPQFCDVLKAVDGRVPLIIEDKIPGGLTEVGP